MNLFSKYKTSFFRERHSNIYALSTKESKNLYALAKNISLVISKFDKGNGVAVLNKEDYIRKMLVILQDETKFVPVEKMIT